MMYDTARALFDIMIASQLFQVVIHAGVCFGRFWGAFRTDECLVVGTQNQCDLAQDLFNIAKEGNLVLPWSCDYFIAVPGTFDW